MSIQVIDKNGKVIEEIELSSKVDIEKQDDISHMLYLVKNYQNHQARQKSACTKTRAEVRGGGAKPYKQKGTGRARRGTNRTPLRVGGGVIFGPRPIKRIMKVNNQVVKRTIQDIILLKGDKVKFIKTDDVTLKEAKKIIQDEKKSILVISNPQNNALIYAFRNFQNCNIVTSSNISIERMVAAELILIDYQEKSIVE